MEVLIALTTFGALIRTASIGTVSWLAQDDMTHLRSEDGVCIRIPQDMFQKCFDIDIFFMLCRMYCNPILGHLAIARLAQVDWSVDGFEWFPIDHGRTSFIVKPPVT